MAFTFLSTSSWLLLSPLPMHSSCQADDLRRTTPTRVLLKFEPDSCSNGIMKIAAERGGVAQAREAGVADGLRGVPQRKTNGDRVLCDSCATSLPHMHWACPKADVDSQVEILSLWWHLRSGKSTLNTVSGLGMLLGALWLVHHQHWHHQRPVELLKDGLRSP